jgi:hypothetical protein
MPKALQTDITITETETQKHFYTPAGPFEDPRDRADKKRVFDFVLALIIILGDGEGDNS